MTPDQLDNAPPPADEVNRLWQHGMHEERLFHDRLNYFSGIQVGLLGVFAILYNKDPVLAVSLPIAAVALAFTILWFGIQIRHWKYCLHVNAQIRRLVPEYRRTVDAFAGPGRTDGMAISRPLAFAVPILFATTWVAFLIWVIVRATRD